MSHNNETSSSSNQFYTPDVETASVIATLTVNTFIGIVGYIVFEFIRVYYQAVHTPTLQKSRQSSTLLQTPSSNW